MIYLDHNATTPVDPGVRDAMMPFLSAEYGNPSSSHMLGRSARRAVEEAREKVTRSIGAAAGEIIFTSGGTESNNLAILGTALRLGRGHVITTAVEHPAVLAPCVRLEELGYRVTLVPVDASGRVSVDEITASIRDDTILVTVMHSNNETGTLQPVSEIAGALAGKGILLHTDAAQSMGKVSLNVTELGVDFMSLAGHKFYAPKGVGALYIRNKTPLMPVLYGAGHERGLRPGTENTPMIAGIGEAARLAVLTGQDERMRLMSERFLNGLRGIRPDIKLNGHETLRLPNTLNICLPGVSARKLLDALDGRLAASTASACHGAAEVPSGVLKAMGLSDADALSSIRFSLGRSTSEADVDAAIDLIDGVIAGGLGAV